MPRASVGCGRKKAQPILRQFKDWLEDRLRELAPKSPTAKAIGYALKNWQALERFTEDGRLEIDNNRSERAIRPLAIGRKNWLFLGSPRGGQAAATVFSLIQTCKELDLNPEAYFEGRAYAYTHHQAEGHRQPAAPQLEAGRRITPRRLAVRRHDRKTVRGRTVTDCGA